MADPSTERITAERGDELFTLARRWGRFGDGDERGALNLLTPERTRRAAGLVVDGTVVSCGRDLAVRPGVDNPTPALHHMVVGGDVCAVGWIYRQDPRARQAAQPSGSRRETTMDVGRDDPESIDAESPESAGSSASSQTADTLDLTPRERKPRTSAKGIGAYVVIALVVIGAGAVLVNGLSNATTES